MVIGGQATVGQPLPPLAYGSPFVTALALSPGVSTTLDCTVVDAAGTASRGSVAAVVVAGGNFGGDLGAVNVTIGPVAATVLAVTQTQLVVETRQCAGEETMFPVAAVMPNCV